MNIPAQARRDIKLVASMVKGLVALDEALDEAGSAEKMLAATQASVDALRAQETGLASKIADAGASVDAANAKAAKIVNDATDAAAGITVAADATKKSADDVMAQAKASYDQLVADGQREAERIKSSQNDELAALATQVAAAQQVLADAQAAIVVAAQQKSAIEAEIAALKQKFA